MPLRNKRPVVIKRYAGSRLYDAANTRYVTAQLLRRWAIEGLSFIIVDSETGANVTRVFLTRYP